MTIDYRLDEGQRQLVILALARLTAARPGFAFACLECADVFGGVSAQAMLMEFARLNADLWKPDHPAGTPPTRENTRPDVFDAAKQLIRHAVTTRAVESVIASRYLWGITDAVPPHWPCCRKAMTYAVHESDDGSVVVCCTRCSKVLSRYANATAAREAYHVPEADR